MKYTALEILEAAGFEKPAEKFGKFGINIAGVTANKPDHIINVQAEKKILVRVGRETKEVELPERETHSEAVQAAIEAKGKAATEARIASGKVEAPREEGADEATTE